LAEERIKVLHVLANSRPDLNGYAIRTHDLLMAQWNTQRVHPIGLTSPFYPDRESMISPIKVDEIEYFRSVHPSHDSDAKGFSSWWLSRRAHNKISKKTIQPSIKPEPHQQVEQQTELKDDSPVEESKQEEINKSRPFLIKIFAKPYMFTRKLIRYTYRLSKRTVRRTVRFFIRKSKYTYRLSKRTVRRTVRFFIRKSRKVRRFTRRSFRIMTRPVRSMLSPFPMWIEERLLMRKLMRDLIKLARQESVQIIHAHTPYRVGRPALLAARKLNLPFVYEMRGIWEDTAVANGRWKPTGLAYRRYRAMETKVLRSADRVICISETLAGEAISRGVSPGVINIVQNAVDPSKIIHPTELESSASKEDNQHLRETIERLNRSESTCVVGYIGSLRDLEGVDLTADAVGLLHSKGCDVRLLVLSGKANQEILRERCENLGLGDTALVTGPVPHERVPHYYDLIDIFVVSRPDERVTRLVTPLKPFEAMMLGRAIIVSDLPALAEIVEDGERGILFKAGDVSDLAEKIRQLMDDQMERVRLGTSAKEWVESERIWPEVVKGSLQAYDAMLNPK
jgi:glycosyltransferase involved in cell wall biosynthesis